MHLGGTQIRGPGLVHLAGLTGLEELWFVSDELTDEATPLLGQFRALKKLTYGGKQITGRGLGAWGTLSELRELGLNRCPLTEEAMAVFPDLPALESLALDCWSSPGDAAVRALPPLAALESLSLNNSAVGDAA